MDLFLNDQKITTMNINPDNSVGQIKQTLSNWLEPQGHTNYKIKLIFNNGAMLDSPVFSSGQYDNINFQNYTKLLNGGRILVIVKTPESNDWDKLPNDVIIHMALDMSLDQVYNLCLVKKKFNKLICNNTNFWIQKLLKDFKTDWKTKEDNKYNAKTPKSLYQNLHMRQLYSDGKRNSNGILQNAVEDNQYEFVEKLVNSRKYDIGAINLDDRNKRNHASYINDIISAYHKAVELGNPYIIDLFIRKYAKPKYWDSEIIVSAQKGNLDAVKYFAKVVPSKSTIQVAMEMAKEAGHSDVANYLKTLL